MLNLIKKEIALCMHPTAFIFLFFAVLVFVPNYPYEVIFFFSCLSIFFCCMMTRENGDIAFSCALPVKKEQIPFAKMLVVFGLQCIILLLVGVIGAIKGAVLPAEQYVNQAGISANLVLVGNGAILLGTFNLIFFPRQNRSPFRNRCSCYIFANQRFYRFALGNAALFYYSERTQFRKYRRKTRGTCYRYCCLCCFICCNL